MDIDTEAARDFAECGDNYTGQEVRVYVHNLADQVDRLRAQLEVAQTVERERLLGSLTRHDWSSANIWRHYYPSANGEWVDLQELRKVLGA